MNLSKKTIVAVGVLTALPLLYFAFFILSMFFFVFLFVGRHGSDSGALPLGFAVFFLLHVCAILLSFVLIAFYIVHLFRTNVVPNDKKALWAVVLFLGNFLAMPVYWYLYLWRPLSVRKSDAQTPLQSAS
jgi:hypothetical protein